MTAVLLLASIVLILINGFFVAVEFAALGARRAEIDARAAEGNRVALVAQGLQANLGQTLGAAQLGITMASLLVGMIAEPTIAHEIEPAIEALGGGETLTHTLGFAIALGIVAFLHMVVGEMVPKSMSIAAPETSLAILAVPMRAFVLLVSPLNSVLIVMSNLFLRMIRVEPRSELAEAATTAELLSMVDHSAQEGLIDSDDVTLIAAAVRFGQRTAEDLMVPLSEVDAVPISASAAEVEQAMVDTNHARLVVYEDSIEAVRGFVHGKDLLHLTAASRRAPLRQTHVRPMVRIPVGTTLPEVLLAMRRSRIHLGLVVDESRSIGVVNLDRVLAELVTADTSDDDGD
ncbi:MAG: HlyC/CorC family transporter [Actinomycetia bacterium]|nr:HlyC/CorC family transporter [Actinomycetes bacterium]MCP4958362.1 HlyC/CorC family transporter [Actinomycetes bacterium]